MTVSPFKISGPAQICFSGGRTSAFMLHQILAANDGLPDDVHVVFQNTGKEREETLAFIHECGVHWGIPIIWLEWDGFIPPGRNKCCFRHVSFETASRNGEPFADLITALGYLPNPTQRLCTANLKVKTGAAFMRSLGYEEWSNVMGIRADEPRRIARMFAPGRDNSGGEPVLPLASVGVTKRDVAKFWLAQPFDLRLKNLNGVAPEGNCDLCFLKGTDTVYSLIRQDPQKAVWWMEQEVRVAGIPNAGKDACLFRIDRPSYGAMYSRAKAQGDLFGYDDDALADCMCGEAA